ncbi:TPA: hypothetical protein OUE28_002592, partial [Morganella morganii]|nr:hypothetical protein [Morganella morganii]
EWLEKQIKIPVGMFGTFPHRATQLPPKWYSTNGDRFSVSSPQGQALKSLPAELKSDWGIAESGGTINVPNIKQPDGRTPFLRPVNGTVRRVGSVESDTLQNITGSFTIWGGYRESGAFAKEERLASSLADGALVGDYRGSFDASRVARTSDETRPLSIGITLAIYLGV